MNWVQHIKKARRVNFKKDNSKKRFLQFFSGNTIFEKFLKLLRISIENNPFIIIVFWLLIVKNHVKGNSIFMA